MTLELCAVRIRQLHPDLDLKVSIYVGKTGRISYEAELANYMTINLYFGHTPEDLLANVKKEGFGNV